MDRHEVSCRFRQCSFDDYLVVLAVILYCKWGFFLTLYSFVANFFFVNTEPSIALQFG